MADDKLLNKNAVASPTSLIVTFLCNGAFCSTMSKIELKSFVVTIDK